MTSILVRYKRGGVIIIATRWLNYLRNWLNSFGDFFSRADNISVGSQLLQSPALVATFADGHGHRNPNLLLSVEWSKDSSRPGAYTFSARYLVEQCLSTVTTPNSLLNMDVTDIELGWNKLCLSGQDRVGLISDAADHELILRITGGESELFAELVKRYQKKVAALIYSLIQHPDEVEDVAQEVFITIYRHLGRFEHRSSFSTWIYRITVNKCHDWQRRNYRQKGRFGTVADKDVDLTMVDLNQTEDCLLVRQQVGKLDEKYRIVIVLYYFHGLKCREIAGILELPTKSVETRLFRARKLLALNMGREINGGNR